MNVRTLDDRSPLVVGQWRIQNGYKVGDDYEVEQLRELNPCDLVPMGKRFAGCIIDDQCALIRAGVELCPIEVHECGDGTLRVTDGHHRWLAHIREGVMVRAWVSPMGNNGKGVRYKELTGKRWDGAPTEICTQAFAIRIRDNNLRRVAA